MRPFNRWSSNCNARRGSAGGGTSRNPPVSPLNPSYCTTSRVTNTGETNRVVFCLLSVCLTGCAAIETSPIFGCRKSGVGRMPVHKRLHLSIVFDRFRRPVHYSLTILSRTTPHQPQTDLRAWNKLKQNSFLPLASTL